VTAGGQDSDNSPVIDAAKAELIVERVATEFGMSRCTSCSEHDGVRYDNRDGIVLNYRLRPDGRQIDVYVMGGVLPWFSRRNGSEPALNAIRERLRNELTLESGMAGISDVDARGCALGVHPARYDVHRHLHSARSHRCDRARGAGFHDLAGHPGARERANICDGLSRVALLVQRQVWCGGASDSAIAMSAGSGTSSPQSGSLRLSEVRFTACTELDVNILALGACACITTAVVAYLLARRRRIDLRRDA
jgi:hypothetical protein